MSEQSPPVKIPDLSSLPRGAISMKGFPLSRNTRLPTIRSPRDLTLGAQPKRVFTPNIPVRREKKPSIPNKDQSQVSAENTSGMSSKKSPFPSPKVKQRQQRNIIQTEGSLFGEGLAAGTSHNADKHRDPTPRFTAKKRIVKKEFDMSDVDSGINEILRDDFIDDDDDDDEENEDIKPIIYPYQENSEKAIKKEVIKKKQFNDNDFAKDLGFDVNKIAKFIKKEKGTEEEMKTAPDIEIDPECKDDLLTLLKSDDTQLFLLQFPKIFNVQQPDDIHKDSGNSSSKNASNQQAGINKKDEMGLASLSEGPIGKIQILKSGRVRLVIGEHHFYLNYGNTLRTKHEAVSIQTGSEKNDMIMLGNIEHKIIVTPDVDKLLSSVR